MICYILLVLESTHAVSLVPSRRRWVSFGVEFDLSLVARDSVEPVVEKLKDKFNLDLSLGARDTVEPVVEKLTDKQS